MPMDLGSLHAWPSVTLGDELRGGLSARMGQIMYGMKYREA
jgi:hypothetical protein